MSTRTLRIIEPIASLKPYIRHYVIIPGGRAAGGGVFLPYSGAIISFFNEAPLLVNGRPSGVARQTEPTLFGPVAEPIVYQRQTPKRSRDVSVVLTALGSAVLCGPVMDELESGTTELSNFIRRRDLERIRGKLHDVHSIDALVAILTESFQMVLKRRTDTLDMPVLRMLRLLESRRSVAGLRSRYDVDAIREHLHLSSRQLQRVMARTTGLTPKRYLNVLRINEVVERIYRDQTARLSQIAADYGYSDQAHFVRDFERNTLSKPSEFFGSPEHKEHRGFMDVG